MTVPAGLLGGPHTDYKIRTHVLYKIIILNCVICCFYKPEPVNSMTNTASSYVHHYFLCCLNLVREEP